MIYTDEATYYSGLKVDFPAGHFTVQHNIGEYVRGGATVNRCENYFSILKRGLNGVYKHVSPQHLKRTFANTISATTIASRSATTTWRALRS